MSPRPLGTRRLPRFRVLRFRVLDLRIFGVALCGAILAGCGTGEAATPKPSVAAPAGSASAAASATTSPSPAAPPTFVGTSAPATPADVARSWHPGCPVGPGQLAVLRLSYWGFDDQAHIGTMVISKAVGPDVIKVFGILYEKRFPIRRMQPVDAYGGSDPASMADDNTSGFNCRYAVAPGTPQWSAHAYGQAIDVNTVENPYLLGSSIMPSAGAGYRDRSAYRPGMAIAGGDLVNAFASVGWLWGGRTKTSPDYQHFSKTGH